MNINLITVSGIVDKNPTSNIVSGVLYINFELVVNSSTHAGATPQYYAISASGKNAETILNSVNSGDTLFIMGRPSVDTYMKKDKQVVAVQKVWIDKFELFRAAQNELLVPAIPLAIATLVDESSAEATNRED